MTFRMTSLQHRLTWEHIFLLALPNIQNNISSSLKDSSYHHQPATGLIGPLLTLFSALHYCNSPLKEKVAKTSLNNHPSGCFHPTEGQQERLYTVCEPKTENVSHCFPLESAGGHYSRINTAPITAQSGCFFWAVTRPPSSDWCGPSRFHQLLWNILNFPPSCSFETASLSLSFRLRIITIFVLISGRWLCQLCLPSGCSSTSCRKAQILFSLTISTPELLQRSIFFPRLNKLPQYWQHFSNSVEWRPHVSWFHRAAKQISRRATDHPD